MKLFGMFLMIVSVFVLIGALYLTEEVLSSPFRVFLTMAGLLLLAAGIICYKVVRTEEEKP